MSRLIISILGCLTVAFLGSKGYGKKDSPGNNSGSGTGGGGGAQGGSV